MLSKSRKIISVLLLVLILAGSCFLAISGRKAQALDSSDVSYKKKIVSVLFDDSGSMSSGEKEYLARYSLQTMATLLSSEDELYVSPMNASGSFKVDLKAGNRESEIDSKIVNNSSLNATGSTPASSISKSVKILTDHGMNKSQSVLEESDKEYWLVILTDGEFTETGKDINAINNKIVSYIDGYNYLNTIYISFGSGGVNLTDPNLPLNKNYAFSAFFAEDEKQIVGTMENVSNKISGKLSLINNSSTSYYSISGNTVTIDLNKCDFPINSLSVIAQDCGAKLKSATFNETSLSVSSYSVLKTCNISNMKEGYSAILKNSEVMQKNKIILTFDKPISKVSILVEPVLSINPYFEYYNGSSWERADMQFISSNMKTGDKIKARYEVVNSYDGNTVDISKIFDTPVEKVVYCNTGYKIGQEFALVKGNHPIDISVSLLGGLYTLHVTVPCYIEDNPTYYRVEADVRQGTGSEKGNGEVIYSTFVQNKKLTKTEFLNDYTYETSIINLSTNQEISTTEEVQSDGTVRCEFKNLDFGKYQLKFKVTSKSSRISRSVEKTVTVMPSSILAKTVSGDISSSVYKFEFNTTPIQFGVDLEGSPISFNDKNIKYTLSVDGKTVTDGITVNDKVLEFVPNTAILGSNVAVGEKEVKLTVSFLDTISSSATTKINIVPTAYHIERIDYGTSEFDRYRIDKANAGVYFAIYHDDVPFSEEELQTALENESIKINTNPFGWITLLPCKVDISVEEINGVNAVACKVKRDIIRPFASLFGSFIFVNEKTIEITYGQENQSALITITPVSMLSRIIRWIILLLIILFIVHVTLYIIGFKKGARLPSGCVLKADMSSKTVSFTPTLINTTTAEVLAFHLKRFIPFMVFYKQNGRNIGSGIKIEFSKKTGKLCFKMREDSITAYENDDDSTEYTELKNYVEKLRKIKDKRPIPPNIKTNTLMNLIYLDDEIEEKGKDVGRISEWHAIRDSHGKIKLMVKFVGKSRR